MLIETCQFSGTAPSRGVGGTQNRFGCQHNQLQQGVGPLLSKAESRIEARVPVGNWISLLGISSSLDIEGSPAPALGGFESAFPKPSTRP